MVDRVIQLPGEGGEVLVIWHVCFNCAVHREHCYKFPTILVPSSFYISHHLSNKGVVGHNIDRCITRSTCCKLYQHTLVFLLGMTYDVYMALRLHYVLTSTWFWATCSNHIVLCLHIYLFLFNVTVPFMFMGHSVCN